MASFVHNESGILFREISPVGQTITVTPEIAGYLRTGVIFMRESSTARSIVRLNIIIHHLLFC